MIKFKRKDFVVFNDSKLSNDLLIIAATENGESDMYLVAFPSGAPVGYYTIEDIRHATIKEISVGHRVMEQNS